MRARPIDGTAGDQLRGLVVCTREAGCLLEPLHGSLSGVFPDEVLGHQTTRGGRLGAKRKAQALDALGESVGLCEARCAVRDEVGLVVGVLDALSDGPRTRDGLSGLHTGEATEPRELNVAALEHLYTRGVVRGGHIPNIHTELGTQMLGEPIELGLQLGGVLIRNRREAEHLGRDLGRAAAHQSDEKKREEFVHGESDAARSGPRFTVALSRPHTWPGHARPKARFKGRAISCLH